MSKAIELTYRVPPELMLSAAWSSSSHPKRRLNGPGKKVRNVVSIALWTVFFWVLLVSYNTFQLSPRMIDILLGVFVGVGGSFGIFIAYAKIVGTRLTRLAVNHDLRCGDTKAVFQESGIVQSTKFGRYEVHWGGVDSIIELGGGTGIAIGTLPVPDSALPEGYTPEAFRDELRSWKAKA